MAQRDTFSTNKGHNSELYKIGFILIGAGVFVFLDQFLKTRWLTLSIPAITGIVLIFYGYINHQLRIFTAGWILLASGLALFLGLQQLVSYPLIKRFGFALIGFSIGWLLLFLLVVVFYKHQFWWALIVSAATLATGYTLSFTDSSIFMYVLTLCLAIGIVFLVWGFVHPYLGLIIAGSIIATTGIGIFFGWANQISETGLLETGVMLVWFALGWLLITIFARVIYRKFIWWPIIPGGIIGMVGWGLYIGGGPSNAVGFVSNTGSIALILFGLYLILLKFGMRK